MACRSPRPRFFPAKLIDDQKIDTFEHRMLDPCVDAREGLRIKAASPRFVAAVRRDLYFVTAQQVLHIHIASTSAMPMRV
jgi:hypothetical protein